MKRVPSPHTTILPLPGESDGSWTNRLCAEGQRLGVYRQCSIGYHRECSQRRLGPDAECRCLCHATPPVREVFIEARTALKGEDEDEFRRRLEAFGLTDIEIQEDD